MHVPPDLPPSTPEYDCLHLSCCILPAREACMVQLMAAEAANRHHFGCVFVHFICPIEVVPTCCVLVNARVAVQFLNV